MVSFMRSVIDRKRRVVMGKFLKVGKIVNTHGVRGELRVISQTDFPEKRYAKGNVLYLEHPNFPEKIELKVSGHRKHKQFDLLRFEGYESMNDVESFKEGILKVSEDQIHELGENEFYYHEIIGCHVETENGEFLGSVKEILSPGANDVWVVKREKGKDLLIPYIEAVVKDINIKDKVITIHLMEGLLDE